jgi:hypothetical protein
MFRRRMKAGIVTSFASKGATMLTASTTAGITATRAGSRISGPIEAPLPPGRYDVTELTGPASRSIGEPALALGLGNTIATGLPASDNRGGAKIFA